MTKARIGMWIVGARGSVSATTILGLVALRKGLTDSIGLVSELPQFSRLNLADWDQVVVGGHEIRTGSIMQELQQLHQNSRVFSPALLESCREEIEEIDAAIKRGTHIGSGEKIASLANWHPDGSASTSATVSDVLSRLESDLKSFIRQNELHSAVVVNLMSTEPQSDVTGIPDDWLDLESLLADVASPDESPLPASSLYAIAAMRAGAHYVNFTPSLGSNLTALNQLALRQNVCHIGRDGKTGETLLKSTLAPMFAARHLKVLSWVGHNIFGNRDGVVLDSPENKATKVQSKDQLLGRVLGYVPQTHTSIEHIESLGDWKTAWDHIHFSGFLNTPMTLQLTWQGCDSLLAAPLVLDLVRLVDRSAKAGETGLLRHLACFFKSPAGTSENDFVRQFQQLEQWAAQTASSNV